MNWTQHNEMISSQTLPPAETLLETFKRLEAIAVLPGKALDLGSGAGIDAMALLQRGWQVTAIDKDAGSIALLRSRVQDGRLHCIHSSFEDMQLLHTYQLVNASFSLPFCPPGAFLSCWQKVRNAVEEGGYFCGHLFGHKDDWHMRPDVTTLSEKEVNSLFDGFEIVWQKEVEKDMPSANGHLKHWHIFAVCARKL